MNIFLVVLCAALNRARGDDRWMPSWLPGRALWYVAPAVGLSAWAFGAPVFTALAATGAYLFWALWAWGRWFDLHRHPDGYNRDGIEPTIIELAIGAASFGSDHVALFLRHLMVLPGIILLFWGANFLWPLALSVAFAAAVVAIYEAAWRLVPTYPIPVAEVATGALWGFLILAA
ncbi:conserved membrane hypothetical protein [Hyphomicrobiales bacterium]|nr:conserved membrane hypothetical protein [Hyphomicrobiales bacterium]CAH1668336.1 conserved membrane hypothetical protein [Hyphomicrobiales bacterium]